MIKWSHYREFERQPVNIVPFLDYQPDIFNLSEVKFSISVCPTLRTSNTVKSILRLIKQ